MNYKEAQRRLRQVSQDYYTKTNQGLMERLDWFNIKVEVVHEEGTILHFQNASLIEIDKEYIGVITEHQGSYIWDKDDLISYRQYKQDLKKNVKLTDLEKEMSIKSKA